MFLCIDCDNFFLQPMTKWKHLESLSLIALGISAGCSDLFLLSSDRFPSFGVLSATAASMHIVPPFKVGSPTRSSRPSTEALSIYTSQ